MGASRPPRHRSAPVLQPAGEPAHRPPFQRATETSQINYGGFTSPLPSLDLLNDLQKQARNACRVGGGSVYVLGAFRVTELPGVTSLAQQEHPSQGNPLRALPVHGETGSRSLKGNAFMRRREKFIGWGLELVTTVGWSTTQ